MSKILDHTTVLYTALNVIKNNATTVIFCNQQPTNYADLATTGRAIITRTGLTSSNFTGPADDSGNGNRATLTVNPVLGSIPSIAGTVTYVVLTNGSNTIYAGTSVTSQAVLTSQTWDSPAFKIAIADPA